MALHRCENPNLIQPDSRELLESSSREGRMSQGELKDVIYQVLHSRRKIFVGLLLLCLGTTALRTVMLVGRDDLVPKGVLHRKVKPAVHAPQPQASARMSKHTRQGPASRTSRSKGARSSRGGKAGGNQIGSVAKDLRARKAKSRPRSTSDLDYQRTSTDNMLLDESGAYIWRIEREDDDDQQPAHGNEEAEEEDLLIEDAILEDIDIQDTDLDLLELDTFEATDAEDNSEKEEEVGTMVAAASENDELEEPEEPEDDDRDAETEGLVSDSSELPEEEEEFGVEQQDDESPKVVASSDSGGKTQPLEKASQQVQVTADDILQQNLMKQQTS